MKTKKTKKLSCKVENTEYVCHVCFMCIYNIKSFYKQSFSKIQLSVNVRTNNFILVIDTKKIVNFFLFKEKITFRLFLYCFDFHITDFIGYYFIGMAS